MPVTRKRKQDNPAQSQSSQSAKTHLEFSAITQYQAYYRQWNRCACCGESLTFQRGRAHHVIPAQAGNTGNLADTFLRSVDNCVILCSYCYSEVGYAANYGENAISPPNVYRYSHGLEKNFHQQWAKKLQGEQQKYGPRYNATITMLH